jgi:hypothetical protein
MVNASAVGGTLNRGVRIADILHRFIYVNCSSFLIGMPIGYHGSQDDWNLLTKGKRKINGGKKTLPVLQNAYLSDIKIRKKNDLN